MTPPAVPDSRGPAAPFDTSYRAPGSKSITNRALVLASMTEGTTILRGALVADDTRVMIEGLGTLGHNIIASADGTTLTVTGHRQPPNRSAEIQCGNSGTTLRFLLASLTRGHGTYTLDGVVRMRQRPLGDMGRMLKDIAVRLEYPMAEGFPPVRLLADGLAGGLLQAGSRISSQYLSAILMVAPFARNEMHIGLPLTRGGGGQTSWPYVAMTMRVMHDFGVTPELVRDEETGLPQLIIIPQDKYIVPADGYDIEPDASGASYFAAAAAITPGSRLQLEGLGRDSIQGDMRFVNLLGQMGAKVHLDRTHTTIEGTDDLQAIEADMTDCPDMAQTLAVVALFAEGTTVLRGLHTLRVKETDRIAALASELTKLGAAVEVTGDDNSTLEITPPAKGKHNPARIATYDDHRMAMSFAVAAARWHNIVICDAQCVSKTFPDFFADFQRVTAVAHQEV